MKLRQPWLIALAGMAGAWLVRIWIWTLRYRYHYEAVDARPYLPGLRDRFIYAFWHENILLLAYHYGRPNVHVLVSQHADGQLIAEIIRRLGFGLVRGSTTRGGVEAVRQMLRSDEGTHL